MFPLDRYVLLIHAVFLGVNPMTGEEFKLLTCILTGRKRLVFIATARWGLIIKLKGVIETSLLVTGIMLIVPDMVVPVCLFHGGPTPVGVTE